MYLLHIHLALRVTQHMFIKILERISRRSNTNLIEHIVSAAKIEWAFGKFNSYKSAGPDYILPAMLRAAPHHVIRLFCILFWSVLYAVYIPQAYIVQDRCYCLHQSQAKIPIIIQSLLNHWSIIIFPKNF